MSKIKNIITGEVHALEGTKTGCGFDTKENPENWEYVSDNSKITCDKNGCKN